MKDDTPIISDINLSQRKTFRIDGDNDRMLSLDISDMNVIVRLKDAYPKMKQAALNASKKVESIKDTSSEDVDGLTELAEALRGIDTEMREQLDYVFDSNVSEICAPKGTLYDPYGGQFRFEHILDVLTGLYTTNLNQEFNKMKANVGKHTNKYTKKYHK